VKKGSKRRKNYRGCKVSVVVVVVGDREKKEWKKG